LAERAFARIQVNPFLASRAGSITSRGERKRKSEGSEKRAEPEPETAVRAPVLRYERGADAADYPH
jgi:hypothetical protein